MTLAVAEDRRRAAAVLSLLVIALAGETVGVVADSGGSADAFRDTLLTAISIAVTAVVGALIALARPGNLVGWIVLATAVAGGVGEGLVEPAVRAQLAHTDPHALSAWVLVVGLIFRSLTGTLGVAAVPAWFPDGHLAGPRWKWLVYVMVAAVVITVAASLIAPIETRLGDHWRGPLTPGPDPANSPLQLLDVLGALLGVVATVGALASIIARWRRGSAVVRQQLLLFAVAIGVDTAGLLGVLLLVVLTPHTPGRWVFAMAGLPVPIAVAVAMLRHGLYDLRRSANRALLWFLLTVMSAGIYVLVVATAAALSPDRGAIWPPVLAATAAAIALLALHRRLQALAARVVYGRWHEPYELLAAMGQRLSGAADLDQLLADALAQLGGELDLTALGLSDRRGALIIGDDGGESAVPLVASGQTVGTLSFTCDRQLSDRENELIRDLGTHLASALHVRQLVDDLRRTRERLVLGREEERRSLRRELHDGLGPALAGLTLKAETARALLPGRVEDAELHLDALTEEIRATVSDVRRIVEGLRPAALDDLGLVGACEQLGAQLSFGTSLAVRVRADSLPDLPAATEVAAFRIAQEAATNAARHARAHAIELALTRSNGSLKLSVRDDGVGIAASESRTPMGGHGMTTMRERAQELGGSLEVASDAAGTTVVALLPLAGTGARA
ncbi:MAG: sensor histidine kinase [Marmoricola sp.]